MRFRRHLPPLRPWPFGALRRAGARRWALLVLGAGLAGYLTAALVLFPAPVFQSRRVVPRVLSLSLAEAATQLRKAGLAIQDGGAEPHPTAPRGTVVWQDPPPGVAAPAGLRVTLVSSDGPPKIPVPDVTGLAEPLAERLVRAAGLSVARVESVQAAAPPGVALVTRPAAPAAVVPGAPVAIVVSRGAPTIPVPNLLGMAQADARTRLEHDGLALGTVTRRRTADATPGTVVAQQPAANTLAAPGTVVDIVVARSP
jgi:beta-lactam-binding protein with PASTA domain